MKILKVVGKISFGLLLAFSILMTALNIHYVYFVDNRALGITYIGDQTPVDLVEKKDELTEEEVNEYEDRMLFEVSYYSNDAQNGSVLQEVKMNYFTDQTLTTSACRSTGMQSVSDMSLEPNYDEVYGSFDILDFTNLHYGNRYNETEAPDIVKNSFVSSDEYVPEGFYYYDTTDMISWNGGYGISTKLNRATSFIIKIDNEAYCIQLDGVLKYNYYWNNFNKLFGIVSEGEAKYDFSFIFVDLMKAVKSNSQGYGDYYITLDLSRYFTNIQKYDAEDGKWKKLPNVDIVKNYATIKFHYDENGVVDSDQSLFGVIANNPKVENSDIDTDYWQERYVYNLTEKHLDYRYSETYGGYFASLSQDMKTKFESMPRTKVMLSIDLLSSHLSSQGIDLIGLDFDAFSGFEIDTLQITGKTQSFYILEGALIDSDLKTLKHSSKITLEISEGATNNTYEEVMI